MQSVPDASFPTAGGERKVPDEPCPSSTKPKISTGGDNKLCFPLGYRRIDLFYLFGEIDLCCLNIRNKQLYIPLKRVFDPSRLVSPRTKIYCQTLFPRQRESDTSFRTRCTRQNSNDKIIRAEEDTFDF